MNEYINIDSSEFGQQSHYQNIFKPVDSSRPNESIDLLVRIQHGSIIATPTENVSTPLHQILVENKVLKRSFKNLWKKNKYSQEYISFLLGSYTDEEFMAVARKYAEHHDEIDKENLLSSVEILNSVIGPLTSYELSYLLNADCSDIDRKMITTSVENDR